MIQTILEVARRFPVIRFDAAMTLARKHVQRLWYPPPGHGGAIPSRAANSVPAAEFDACVGGEFWREVVERVREEVPDTLLLAEAFWMMEGYFVRTRVRTKYPSIIQNASASSSVSGTSSRTRSTTSLQNSPPTHASNSAAGTLFAARDGMAPPWPGGGYQSRCTCLRASVMAASNRMTGKRRATSRMVWITASRTPSFR